MDPVTPGTLTLTPAASSGGGAYPGTLIPGLTYPGQPRQALTSAASGTLPLTPR